MCLLPTGVRAQADPLNSAYKPAVDCNVADYPNFILASGADAKLKQTDTLSALGSYGSICPTIYGTQNEFIQEQIHVFGGASGITNLSVAVSNLCKTTGPGTNSCISAASTDIIVYREYYMNLPHLSGNAANPSLYPSPGLFPDAIVPAKDPYYHQTTNGFPVNVSANQMQSVWIDVHVPPSAASGFYSGTITVSGNGGTLAVLPAVYGVWQWPASQGGQMPSTSGLLSDFRFTVTGGFCKPAYPNGTQFNCPNYPGGGVDQAETDGAILILDHRISLSNFPQESSSLFPGVNNSWTTYDALIGPLMNGTTGHVPGILVGAKLTTIETSCTTLPCTATERTNFFNHFTANGWFNRLSFYLADEPGGVLTAGEPLRGGNGAATQCGNSTFTESAIWTAITNCSALFHAFSPPYTNSITSNLTLITHENCTSCTDWLTANEQNWDDPFNSLGYPNGIEPGYPAWASGNCCGAGSPPRKWGFYETCSNVNNCGGTNSWLQAGAAYSYGNFNIDGRPVPNRSFPWMMFFRGATYSLYYSMDGQFIAGNTSLWSNNEAFNGFGEGDFLYACQATQCGVTTPLWIPSIRLKLLRDGYQDWEYLNLLTSMGQGALVQQQLSCWITNNFTFNENPNTPSGSFTCDLEDARQTLGNAMQALTFGNPAPPTGLIIKVAKMVRMKDPRLP